MAKSKFMITFRPHHFFCTLAFQGKGYSPEFVNNFQKLKDDLVDETPIRVVFKADDICSPCPHRRSSLCEKQSKIDRLDYAHAEALSLKNEQIIAWGEAKERLSHLSIEQHHRICDGCSWRDLGLCEAALKTLKSQKCS